MISKFRLCLQSIFSIRVCVNVISSVLIMQIGTQARRLDYILELENCLLELIMHELNFNDSVL